MNDFHDGGWKVLKVTRIQSFTSSQMTYGSKLGLANDTTQATADERIDSGFF